MVSLADSPSVLGFSTANLGPAPEFGTQGTALMVNGVLYAMGGARRAVAALDPSTGELLWKFAAATVYGSEPLPAWPEREQGERCACGAELEYFTSVDELHMEPHPDRRSQGGKSCGAH